MVHAATAPWAVAVLSGPLLLAVASGGWRQRHFTPAMRLYTTRLTRARALYFVGMIVLSFSLYALAPWPWWSLFCNLLTPLAVGVFFAGEHLLRYHWHPEFERLSLRGALQAWRARG